MADSWTLSLQNVTVECWAINRFAAADESFPHRRIAFPYREMVRFQDFTVLERVRSLNRADGDCGYICRSDNSAYAIKDFQRSASRTIGDQMDERVFNAAGIILTRG